jgi:hypothetical protein
MEYPLDTRPLLESKLLARVELQQSVSRLSSLVCDLLIENQRLRHSLSCAGEGARNEQPSVNVGREWTLA